MNRGCQIHFCCFSEDRTDSVFLFWRKKSSPGRPRKSVPWTFTWDVWDSFKILSSLIQTKDLNLGLLYPRQKPKSADSGWWRNNGKALVSFIQWPPAFGATSSFSLRVSLIPRMVSPSLWMSGTSHTRTLSLTQWTKKNLQAKPKSLYMVRLVLLAFLT